MTSPKTADLQSSFLKIFLCITVILIVNFSCRKKKTEDPDRDLTTEEIQALSPPTYGQFLKAYEMAIANDASLADNESALLQVIAKWLKQRPNGELSITKTLVVSATGSESKYINASQRLTPDEWKLVRSNIIKSVRGYYSAQDAEEAAVENYPCDVDKFDNTKLNAILHSYWSALLAKRLGAQFAKDFTTAHESQSPASAPYTKMDLHNNAVGIALVEKNPKATEKELLELLVTQKFTFVLPLDKFPENVEGLIFITDKRPLDGTMIGSQTNPDAQRTWTATYDFNQCGSNIKGQVTIVSGSSKQVRRFFGSINESGIIKLNVSDPFVFENPDNLEYCREMSITLSGSAEKLSGTWFAPNCTKGGSISISK